MAQKKNLDSGLTPKETTKKEVAPEERLVKVKDISSLEEKIDAIADSCIAILKHLGEADVADDLEARRGKFGTQVPPRADLANRGGTDVKASE